MPNFTIQAPDGRQITIQADDQDTAIRGAQSWAQANPKPAAKPVDRSYIGGMADRAVSAFTTAGHNLAEDARTAYAPATPQEQANSGQGQLRSTPRLQAADRLGGDVWNTVTSPVTAAFRAAGNLDQQDAQFLTNVAPAFVGAPKVGAGDASGLATGRAASVPKSVAQAFAPTSIAAKTAKFDQAGVTPTLAAVGPEGSAQVAKFAAENPFVGGVPKRRLQRSIDETGQAANKLASQFGSPASRAATGDTIQTAAQRFANGRGPATITQPAQQTSFSAKAGALYDRAFSGLDSAMAGKTDVGSSQITTPATSAALKEMANPAQAQGVSEVIRDPTIAKLASAVESGQGDLSFNDLRQLRTWVRTAQKNTDLRQSIGDANLGRLEGALTDDIYANAGSLGSPALQHNLQRADQFYAAGQARISNALNSTFKAKSGESAYDGVVSAALDGGRADVQRLLSVKRTLRPDEWGDVAATALQRLGQPTPGTAAVADGAEPFSVGSFVTNYNRLSPDGREILFGARGGGGAKAQALRQQLDNLAQVASMQKNVERAANSSNTAVVGQAAGTMGALGASAAALAAGNPAPLAATVLSLGGVRGLGEVMTNPVFVRWLAGTAKANPSAIPSRLAGLQQIAKRYPNLAGVAAGVTAAIRGQYPSGELLPATPQAGAVVAARVP